MRNKKSLILFLTILVMPYVSLAQIKMPAIFTDSMVLQQKMPMLIWGSSALKKAKIKITLAGKTTFTTSDHNGNWKIKFPELTVGGPYILSVSDGKSSVSLKEILVGEVWLCSGQSNMAFELSKSIGGKDEVKEANFNEIRLFNMVPYKEVRPSAKKIYSQEELQKLENFDFYQPAKWQTCNPKTAAPFSAVAYHFGKQLHKNLGVPIGLIANSVGGTSTQAFIKTEAFKSHPQLLQFVRQKDGKEWIEVAKDIHPWLIERISENLKNFTATKNEVYPHPYAPAYLYESGVKQLIPFGIKGVIWYQGESNATHPEVHDALFTTLVNSWRKDWSQGDFPFYYVQLPKISDRSRWPEFRESQRRLTETLKNVGMAVTIDTGDSLDVHPKSKKVVGERLALIALGKTYEKPIVYSGPVFKSYKVTDSSIVLSFDFAKKLQPANGSRINGFVLHGYDIGGKKEVLYEVNETLRVVNDQQLEITLPKKFRLTAVKYAWALFPDCNLVNEENLPASPFKLEIPGNN